MNTLQSLTTLRFPDASPRSRLERVLAYLADVRAGEGVGVLLLALCLAPAGAEIVLGGRDANGNLDNSGRNLNPALTVARLLLTMFDSRTNLAQQVADEVRRHFANTFIYTIRNSDKQISLFVRSIP